MTVSNGGQLQTTSTRAEAPASARTARGAETSGVPAGVAAVGRSRAATTVSAVTSAAATATLASENHPYSPRTSPTAEQIATPTHSRSNASSGMRPPRATTHPGT